MRNGTGFGCFAPMNSTRCSSYFRQSLPALAADDILGAPFMCQHMRFRLRLRATKKQHLNWVMFSDFFRYVYVQTLHGMLDPTWDD